MRMFKSIQPLCHRYVLSLLSISLCVFITTACSEEDTACDDEMTDCATPSVNNTPTATNPPSVNNPSNATIPNNPPEETVNLVCGQIIRDTDHPGAYNEPVTFSNTAEATLVLYNINTLDLVELTTQSGPFELPLDYCITGPASFLDTNNIYVVFGFVNQDNDNNGYKIGDLFTSQRIYEEDPPAIDGITLPQHDAVTPLAGLEDCTADNAQFDCLIACDHPDIALYTFCEDECADNPSQSHCLAFVER